MAIKDRIKEARINKKYTQEQLATLIGVAKSTVTGYEKGNSEPSIETMGKIMSALDVDANFLWQDETDFPIQVSYMEMDHIKKYRALDEYGKGHVDTVLQWESDRMAQLRQASASAPAATAPVRLIQYYQRLASAGSGQIVFDGVPVEQIEIPDRQEYRRVSYAVGVNGQSMEPLYKDGDILLIEPTCQLEQGEVGIFIVGNNAYVKKLGETELISVNKDYKNIPLTEDTKCMGRVVDKL